VHRTAAALALAVSLLASSCSTTLQGTATAAGTPASSSAAPTEGRSSAAVGPPTESLQALTLTAADFPAPYQPMPRQSLRKCTSPGNEEYTPAECRKLVQFGTYDDLATVGAAGATDPASSSTLTTFVTPVGAPLKQLDAELVACTSFTAKVAGAPAPMSTNKLAQLPDPAVAADLSRAYRDSLQAADGPAAYVVMFAELRGLLVTVVNYTKGSRSNPDPALVTSLLTMAVAKVAAG
jgi:hypothetical protein